MYRVIEVARLLNVSKVTVYKKISQLKSELQPYLVEDKNITYLKPEGLELIKDALDHGRDTPIIPEIEVLKLQETVRQQSHQLEHLNRDVHYLTQSLVMDLNHTVSYLEQVLKTKKSILENRIKTIELLKAQLL